MAFETRYGKWAFEVVTLRFGKSAGGQPVLDELILRVPVTLSIVFGAILLAYLIAVPLGTLGAAARGRRLDAPLMIAVLLLYATPTAVRVGSGSSDEFYE